VEIEEVALKNRKNELTGTDNIGKLKVLEGKKGIDISKAVDLTVNDDIMGLIEEEKEVLVHSDDEEEEDEKLTPKEKRKKTKEIKGNGKQA